MKLYLQYDIPELSLAVSKHDLIPLTRLTQVAKDLQGSLPSLAGAKMYSLLLVPSYLSPHPLGLG